MSPMFLATIEQVLVGTVKPVEALGEPSAIAKQPVSGPVPAESQGLAGDQQGDLSVHGGPEKAIHLYPVEHYSYWREQFGDHPLLSRPGAFGENLSTRGVTEADICIGDHLRIGTAEVTVSQGRQPCYKLSRRFGITDLAQQVQSTLKTGWYFRVLTPGAIQAGDQLELLERPFPAWPVVRVMELLYRPCLDADELREALVLPLGESWQHTLQRRIDGGQVEDWQGRLIGSSS